MNTFIDHLIEFGLKYHMKIVAYAPVRWRYPMLQK